MKRETNKHTLIGNDGYKTEVNARSSKSRKSWKRYFRKIRRTEYKKEIIVQINDL